MRHPDAEKIRLHAAIGDVVRAKRIAAKMSVRELSVRCGCSTATIEKGEEGVSPFSVFHLTRLALVFDCTIDELVPVLVEAS